MLGAVLAFLSAAFFGLNNATVRRGVINASVLQGMAITVPSGIPIFAVFAVFFGGYTAMADWSLSSWLWMMGAGVVHFVVGRYGNYRTTQALGSVLSTPIQQLSIVVALGLAALLLGETINIVNAFGILIIVLGPTVAMRKKKTAKKPPSGFVPDHKAGLIWGAVCALGYGTSPVMIMLGLGDDRTLADSAAGVLVSYVAATVVVLFIIRQKGGLNYVRSTDKSSLRWFMISSVFVALSQLFRYLALAVAPVSVVVPIQRLSALFRVVFSGLLNREHEILELPLIIVILFSVIGAVMLTADTEMLLFALAFDAETIKPLVRPLY